MSHDGSTVLMFVWQDRQGHAKECTGVQQHIQHRLYAVPNVLNCTTREAWRIQAMFCDVKLPLAQADAMPCCWQASRPTLQTSMVYGAWEPTIPHSLLWLSSTHTAWRGGMSLYTNILKMMPVAMSQRVRIMHFFMLAATIAATIAHVETSSAYASCYL